MRTYFPADDRFVYIKEFMVKRVDTFFFRLVRADTHMLHKSVGHYSKSKSEYFALNTPPIFQDKATFSVWFPEAKRKVLIPKFELSRFLSGNVKISRMLVDADFVHTIINQTTTTTTNNFKTTMANINEQINNQRDAAASGRNNLVSQLASKRVYDEAVRSLDHQDRRPKMNFSRVVSTEHTRLVTDAYPEFSISFTATKNSVHSLAGGLRLLELEYMMMQVPYGSPCYDIGGNYTQHLFKGRSYVHCCNPCLDLKDVARNVMYNDMITQHVQRHKGSGGCRPLPTFQIDAFRRYDSSPCAVTCSDILSYTV